MLMRFVTYLLIIRANFSGRIGLIEIGTTFAALVDEPKRDAQLPALAHCLGQHWRREKVTINFDNALGPHAEALSLRGKRTEVLARNIAHADTPGYLARDLDFKAELASRLEGAPPGAQVPVKRTHAGHQSLRDASAGQDLVTLKYRTPLMGSFDGNSVDTQTEQALFAENNMQFQASLRFLNGKFKGLVSAIKGE